MGHTICGKICGEICSTMRGQVLDDPGAIGGAGATRWRIGCLWFAPYVNSPLGVGEQDIVIQMAMLHDWIASRAPAPVRKKSDFFP